MFMRILAIGSGYDLRHFGLVMVTVGTPYNRLVQHAQVCHPTFVAMGIDVCFHYRYCFVALEKIDQRVS